jgi:hypothetical protein
MLFNFTAPVNNENIPESETFPSMVNVSKSTLLKKLYPTVIIRSSKVFFNIKYDVGDLISTSNSFIS